MARTALPVTKLNPNALTANGSGTAGNADGFYIDTNDRNAINDQVQPELLILDVTVATAETDITIKAGDYPPAIAASAGDYVAACPVGVTKIGPFESGRFLQSDGTLHIDVETAANVTMRAFRVPRNV